MSANPFPDAIPVERAQKPSCFVVAPIGEPESETRKKSDQVLKHLVRKALEPEYRVERADHIERPGIITVQVVQRILDADLVVADLTDRNPNVYFELAIRHATGKPAIHIISRDQDLPFDVQDMRVVPYNLADPDSVEEAGLKLREYVGAIEGGEVMITPVQFAVFMKSLDERGEDNDAQIRALFESLNTGMSNLQQGIAEIVQDLRKKKWEEFVNGSNNVLFAAQPTLNPTTVYPLSPFASSGFNFPSGGRSTLKSAVERPAKAEAIKKAKESEDQK